MRYTLLHGGYLIKKKNTHTEYDPPNCTKKGNAAILSFYWYSVSKTFYLTRVC